MFLEVCSLASSEQKTPSLQQCLDKYYIPLSRLSQGALVLLRKMMPSLESLLGEAIQLAAIARKPQAGSIEM